MLQRGGSKQFASPAGAGIAPEQARTDRSLRILLHERQAPSPAPPSGDMAQSEALDYVSVSDFYAGRSVFVTGASGFLGKVLVEKLLWSCPKINLIYLLLRPKKQENVETRLEKLLKLPLFDRLRESRPGDLQKLIPVTGDLSQPELGLNPFDRDLLLQEVSVVFHSAATTRFNEEIKVATHVNLVGTMAVAELCRRMHKLQAFIHLSTVYCNCNRPNIGEEVYPPPYDPEMTIRMVDAMDDGLRKEVTPQIVSHAARPNAYSLTKALTESFLASNYSDLPIDIVRPSIVTASLKDPIPGWLDTGAGITVMLILAQKGFLRVIPCVKRHVLDIIPVDMVANCIICTPWRRVFRTPDVTPLVYNICSGQQNPISIGNFSKTSCAFMRKHPSHYSAYPQLYLQPNDFIYNILSWLVHTLPAYAMDAFTILFGGKRTHVRNEEKMKKIMSATCYFVKHEWNFSDHNVTYLWNLLNVDDQKVFPFDVKEINWFPYLENYVLGIRRFVLRDCKEVEQKYKKR